MKAVASAAKRLRGKALVAAGTSLLVAASLVASWAALKHCSSQEYTQVVRLNAASNASCSCPSPPPCPAAAAAAAPRPAAPAAAPATPAAAPIGAAGTALLPGVGSVQVLRGPGEEAGEPPEHFGVRGRAAARAAAVAKFEGGDAPWGLRGIPKIFHRIYIADPKDEKRAKFTYPIAHEAWIQSCQRHYSRQAGWTYMYWDWDAADALIATHYAWFLPFYRNKTTKAIEKSDLARYAILHRLGGLYLDSDVECFREGGDLLEGWDAVFQATHAGEGVTNAAIAARPGLDVFVRALQTVQSRDEKSKGTWLGVIERTGPNLLTDSLVAMGIPRVKGNFEPVKHLEDGSAYRFYPAGQFINPCNWYEQDCRRDLYAERAGGQTDLNTLIGWHRLVGSWIPGKEDGLGLLNVTAELCRTGDHEGSNGKVGGWVAPKFDFTKGRRLFNWSALPPFTF